ncbi:MAG TPA: hypothetical protein VH592_11615 [Gemmataceae bacterium]|jgi:hypothetical protein
MGVDEKRDFGKERDGTRRRLPPRLFVLANLTGIALAFLLALFFAPRLFRGWRSDDLDSRFPPDALADYLPEDSAAVIGVNFHELLVSPIGRQHLRKSLQQLIVRSEQQLPWLEWTRIRPIEDIENLLISFASRGGGEPLLLARGRIDRSRFQIGSGMLEQKLLDHSRIWEYSDRPAKETTLLAVVGDMLVVSDSRGRVQAALKQASNPQPTSVRDANLRELLTKVDRKQSIWVAVSVKQLGPVSAIENYLLRMIVRPVLMHADIVYGGITCAEDIRAELHFRSATEENAAHLETDLKSICDAAPGAGLLARQNEVQPLLRLLAVGRIRREGKTIHLACRLTAEQLQR